MSDIKNLTQGVGQIIIKFAGSTPGYNCEVKNGVINNQYTNAFTNSNYDRLNGIVTTTFDSNEFINSSDISVVRTILHESVHAYLVAYFSTDPLSFN
ncbi:hypothetical protein [Pontibacter sp. H249]|uniref:hypothetical protein n=1 Tax=Pontibacter sp. H249 TaxID=3133420 RepID=UPI0030BE994C